MKLSSAHACQAGASMRVACVKTAVFLQLEIQGGGTLQCHRREV